MFMKRLEYFYDNLENLGICKYNIVTVRIFQLIDCSSFRPLGVRKFRVYLRKFSHVLFWFHHCDNVAWKVRIIKQVYYEFSPPFCLIYLYVAVFMILVNL